MNIDKEKFQSFLLQILRDFQSLETELLAYKAVHVALEARIADLDETLEFIRRSPIAQGVTSEKYAALRETFTQLLDGIQTDQDLDRFLREWKPIGSAN